MAAGRLLRQLAREALDIDDPYWPPPWLATGVRVGLAVVVIGITAQMLDALGDAVEQTFLIEHARQAILDYLESSRPSRALSSEALGATWLAFGLLFFVCASFGSLGARIGWCIFGASATAMAYLGAQSPGQPVVGGFVALSWSLASVVAFRQKSRPRRPPREEKRTPQDVLDKLKPGATRAARARGFVSLDEYFADHGNRKLEEIARELKIPRKHAGPLRKEFLEAGISTTSRLTPRVQRNILADIRSGSFTDAQVCERNSCNMQEVRRARKAIKDAATPDGVADMSRH